MIPEPVLFVDDTPEALEVIVRLFAGEHAIFTAASAEQALEMCRTHGPFAVVVSDYEMPGQRGAELLARVREGWPETVTMLLTGVVEVDVAVEALHAGGIFRFLEKPCPREVLAHALRDGIEEYRRRREASMRASQLDFSRQCLEQFNGELESRFNEQARALVRLHRFVSELNGCESVAQVAHVTAEAVREVCDVGAVEVVLARRGDGSDPCTEHSGGELGNTLESQPITGIEGVLGTIRVRADTARRLTESARGMLASLAASCAVAARNAIRRRERDEAQQATIFALAKLAEQRDNETGKHLERVSEYSRLIALGLVEDGWYRELITSEWVDVLAKSAPLHDIGKVGIPDHILLKPGKLTPDEWREMRRHTELGADTLRSVISESANQPFLRMSLDIAWCHHEKWDGSGYPRGLRCEEIPLAARIVALSDVYDALTSERPYKSAWTHDAALQWILQGSGSHFDPRVVDAFVQRAARADEIRARLADTELDLARVAAVHPARAAG
ncbi:MAG: HD domain-containing protein [Planctomycetes bacterium]|nr:HD domain-containing protein [Planctomycetota bacterium]